MCGVSTQTVSRVINKRPDVSPPTRAAVEAAIAAVGFQPSAVARSLVQRRSQTLGVVVAGPALLRRRPDAQRHHRGVRGIRLRAAAQGDRQQRRRSTSCPVIEFLIAHRVEGIIFAAPRARDEHRRRCRAQLPVACPPIVFLKSEPSPAFSTIVIDNYGGARQATEPSARARPATDRPPRRSAGLARGAGPPRRLARRRCAMPASSPGRSCAGNWSSASGEAAFEQMLAQAPDLDGVFVGERPDGARRAARRLTRAGSRSRTTSRSSASTDSTRARSSRRR